jgi:hypothetical protein
MERNLNLHLKSARELMDRARGPVEINWSNWIQAGPEAYYMLSYVNWNFNFLLTNDLPPANPVLIYSKPTSYYYY